MGDSFLQYVELEYYDGDYKSYGVLRNPLPVHFESTSREQKTQKKMSSISSKGKVGVVGSGLVGKSWAMIFASVGYKVRDSHVQS